MNTKALTSALLAGLIRPLVADVNMVSAPIMVKEKGIIVSEVKRDKTGVYDGYIKLTSPPRSRPVRSPVRLLRRQAALHPFKASTWMPMSVRT